MTAPVIVAHVSPARGGVAHAAKALHAELLGHDDRVDWVYQQTGRLARHAGDLGEVARSIVSKLQQSPLLVRAQHP